MRHSIRSLDRILKGEATRPEALRAGSIDVPVAGLSFVHAGGADHHPGVARPVHGILVGLGGDYRQALAFNAGMFAVASLAAQLLLRRWYRPLVARNPRHRMLLRAWLVIYAFVGVQTAWVLRPFVRPSRRPGELLPLRRRLGQRV